MNNQIIPQGPREFIVASATQLTNVLRYTANASTPFTDLVYKFPKTPANTDAAAAGTLAIGQSLEWVASVTLTTGNGEVVYIGIAG